MPYPNSTMNDSTTSGTRRQETDCKRKYEADTQLWDDVWDKVIEKRKRSHAEQCWTMRAGQTLFTRKRRKIQIEQTNDGYTKINITTVRRDASGKPVYRAYTHNLTGKVGQRKDTVKTSMYLHHLGYVKRAFGTSEFLRRSPQHAGVRHTLSHLCGNNDCFTSEHIHFEPHVYNCSRIACSAANCQHVPRCLKQSTTINANVARLNHRFGIDSHGINEAAEASTSRSSLSQPSTPTSSSTNS